MTNFTRFWNAKPSVHCSVNEAPCLTVVKCPRRNLSCILFSRLDSFSCVLWKEKENIINFIYLKFKTVQGKNGVKAEWKGNKSLNFKPTFSISSFLLIDMHLFNRSLYFSSNFCCSSICRLRSQLAYKIRRKWKRSRICVYETLMNIFNILNKVYKKKGLIKDLSMILKIFFSTPTYCGIILLNVA